MKTSLFFSFFVCQRVMGHCFFHIGVTDMGVDLRGVELLVTEDLLEHAYVDVARLIHQGCGGMTELVHRVVLCLEPCQPEVFVNHCLHGFDAHALIEAAEKECAVVHVRIFCTLALGNVFQKRGLTSLVEINDALLASLTRDAQGTELGVDVREIDADQLGEPHAAVEKQVC